MKYFIAVLPFLTGFVSALTPVSDDFNAATLNASRWNYQKGGKGKFTQAGGRLSYKAALPITDDDFASLKLRNNRPSYNESWEVTLDVFNSANKGEKVGVGISIFNSADPTDNVNLEFYGSGAGGGFNFIGVTNDRDDPTKDVRAFPNFSTGRLRISFDGQAKLFTFWYDNPTAGDGFPWTKLCTFSPTGVGGTRRGNWSMSPVGGTFGVQVYGYSDFQSVADGRVFMDNFRLLAVK